jgi:hypothetical protein
VHGARVAQEESMNGSQLVGISLVLAACSACGRVTQTPAQEPKLQPASGSVIEKAAPGSTDTDPTAAEPEKPKIGARPVAVYQNPTSPVTIGADGAVLRFSNGVELRIPAGALSDARNVLVAEDRNARAAKGRLGAVYNIDISVPSQETAAGAQSASEPYASRGEPFVLQLPLPAGADAANLAWETLLKEPKAKTVTSAWSVTAMTRRETAEHGARAVFELETLPDGHVVLTTESESSAPAAK